MLRALCLRQEPVTAVAPRLPTIEQWLGDAQFPLGLCAINSLSFDAKQRLYRILVPTELLGRLGINPVLGRGG